MSRDRLQDKLWPTICKEEQQLLEDRENYERMFEAVSKKEKKKLSRNKINVIDSVFNIYV